VTLGLLGTRQRLSDEFVLDDEAARAVVGALADELKIDLHSAAEAVVRIADHTMAQSVRRVSLNQGYDPRDFAVIAFGGAGPMHAARVADELDIRHVIVPPNAGVFSAVGLLCTDTRTDHVFSDLTLLDDFSDASLATHLDRYVERAQGEGALGDDGAKVVLGLDLRYLEQTYSLTLAVDRQPSLDELRTRFHELHERRYGFSQPDVPVELVNVRVALVSPREKVTRVRQAPAAGAAPREVLEAHVDGERRACTFVARTDLALGEALAGPAVVEEKTATTFVPSGWSAAVDEHEVLHLRRDGN
jgi:N-methylhydantoinase A